MTFRQSQYPKLWKVKKLGDVCEFRNGQAHEQYIVDEGKFIVVNSKFISSDGELYKNTDRSLSPLLVGDIAFVMSDVPNGKALAKCFLVDKNDTYTLNQRIGAIRSTNFDIKYLYYQLNRNKYLLSFDNGENQTNLRKNDILNCPLVIPPLPEQQRIVAILDKAFAAIAAAKENAEKNLKNAKELFESYLHGVFANRGDDWEEKRLGEVCEFKSGTTISPALERSEGDVLYAKVGDMTLPENLIEINTSSRFVNSNEIKINQIIPEGAIIFPKRGGAIATNKKRKIIKPTIVDLNTMAIIPSKKIDKNFLFFWFQLIDLNDISNGTSIPQINNYSFDKVYIPFPKSTQEQQRIVLKFDELSSESKKLEAIYRQKLANLEELKKSILQKAFNGEL